MPDPPAADRDLAGAAAAVVSRTLGWRPVRVVSLAGGFSSAVLRAEPADGGSPVVVRFPGVGKPAVGREALLADMIGGTVPLPSVLFADAEGRVAGRPCLITAWADGRTAEEVLSGGDADDGFELGRALGATLGAIGRYRFSSGGMLDERLERTGEAWFVDTAAETVAFMRTWLEPGGDVRPVLGDEAADTWLRRISEAAPALDGVNGARSLVHSDYNPKNVLVRSVGAGWEVTAVLDWEFAFSGSPLADVGNLLRFTDAYPPRFAEGVEAGLRAAGVELPPGWRTIAVLLDCVAQADLMARGGRAHPIAGKVRESVLRRIAGGGF
ncbi:MAG: phosphotransferase family protein [Gaiellales bacterium]